MNAPNVGRFFCAVVSSCSLAMNQSLYANVCFELFWKLTNTRLILLHRHSTSIRLYWFYFITILVELSLITTLSFIHSLWEDVQSILFYRNPIHYSINKEKIKKIAQIKLRNFFNIKVIVLKRLSSKWAANYKVPLPSNSSRKCIWNQIMQVQFSDKCFLIHWKRVMSSSCLTQLLVHLKNS